MRCSFAPPLRRVVLIVAIVAISASAARAVDTPTSSDFYYQGQLVQSGQAINGRTDLQFTLWDQASGGTRLGRTLTARNVNLIDGWVSRQLKFRRDGNSALFTGAARFLQIAVRSPAGSGPFVTLSPRQQIRPVPYSLFALNAAAANTANSATTATTALTASAVDWANVTNKPALGTGGTDVSTPGALVLRDASGNFSAGTITANLIGNSSTATNATQLEGQGASFYTNAANLTTGTLADGRLSNNVARLNAANAFGSFTNSFAGSVGIGTASPGERLEVAGNIRVADNATIGGRQGVLSAGGALTVRAPGWSQFNAGVPGPGGELRLAAGNANVGSMSPTGTSAGNDVVIVAGDNFAGTARNGNIRFLAGDGQPERMRILGDNGFVGIGVADPQGKLDVNGQLLLHGVGAAGGTVFFADGPINKSLVGRDVAGAAGAFTGIASFATGFNFVVKDDGNTGVGTTTPDARLDVNGSAWISGSDAGLLPESAGPGLRIFNEDGGPAHIFAYDYSPTGGPRNLAIQSAGGRVGIGTSDPQYALDVAGSILARGDGTDGGAVVFADGNPPVVKSYVGRGPFNQTITGIFTSALNGFGLVVKDNGLVGIGTSNPTHAKLEISGSAGAGNGDSNHAFLLPTAVVTNNGALPSFPLSIYASDAVHAPVFRAFSDARIKNIRGRSDAVADLDTLRKIEITDYTFKDAIAKGDQPQKKVIAQQVERIYPMAVHRSTDVVPDIYKKATVKDGWVQLATDLKAHERVRLIGAGGAAVCEVVNVREDGFRVDSAPGGDELFVYGREVSDFLSVDYEAIAMLNVSATQELARQNMAQKARIDELAARLEKLEALLGTNTTSSASRAAAEDAAPMGGAR